MKFNPLNLLQYINPEQSIGGLEITDTFLRFLIIKGGKIHSLSLRLPPGIIERGQVKNQNNFIAALNQFHKRIEVEILRSRFAQLRINPKIIPVIVTISANNIYAQSFNLPYLAINKIEEAAKLNLQIISPIDIKNVYSDWQMIGENSTSTNSQLELLGAFIKSNLAENYFSGLKKANFSIVALEFTPLSLARTIKQWSAGLDFSKPHIVLLISNEGLDFIILKNGNLYFNRFIYWQADVKSLLNTELQKVINFYYGRCGELINNLILITPSPIAAVDETLKNLKLNVQSLKLKPINEIHVSLTNLSYSSLVILGAALRGLISRSEDNLISLTSLGTEEEYFRNRILYFVGVWRNILVSIFSTITASSLLVNWFLLSISNNLEDKLNLSNNSVFVKNLGSLQEKAIIFNNIVSQALQAKQQSIHWMPIFNQLWEAVRPAMAITRFHFDTNNLGILLSGNGFSEVEIINFKNRLINNPNFENVSLPLSQIIREGDKVSFQMSLKMKGKS